MLPKTNASSSKKNGGLDSLEDQSLSEGEAFFVRFRSSYGKLLALLGQKHLMPESYSDLKDSGMKEREAIQKTFEGKPHVFSGDELPDPEASDTVPLPVLSRFTGVSTLTLSTWNRRDFFGMKLFAGYSREAGCQVRKVTISASSLRLLLDFAAGYRQEYVARTHARSIIRQIDRKEFKRIERAGDIHVEKRGDANKAHVGSIEDYLITQQAKAEAGRFAEREGRNPLESASLPEKEDQAAASVFH